MKYLKYLFLLFVLGIISVIIFHFTGIRKVEAKVSEISENNIVFEDKCGNLWEIVDSENFLEKNQTVILYMNDKYTDFLEDDEIIKVKIKED